jgi:hypothetical protein
LIDIHASVILILILLESKLIKDLANGIGILGRWDTALEEGEAFFDLGAESLSEFGSRMFYSVLRSMRLA